MARKSSQPAASDSPFTRRWSTPESQSGKLGQSLVYLRRMELALPRETNPSASLIMCADLQIATQRV
jgi:hypothetical protein